MENITIDIVQKLIREEIANSGISRVESGVMKKEKFSERWGGDISDQGFVQVPISLIVDNELNIAEKQFMTVLMMFGDKIFPSDGKLAEITGLSRRMVGNYLKKLEDKGWISRRVSRKNGTAKRYIDLYTGTKKKLEDKIKDGTVTWKCHLKNGDYVYINKHRKEVWKLIENASKAHRGGWVRASRECEKNVGEKVRCIVEVPPIPPKCILCEKYKKRLITFRLIDSAINYMTEE